MGIQTCIQTSPGFHGWPKSGRDFSESMGVQDTGKTRPGCRQNHGCPGIRQNNGCHRFPANPVSNLNDGILLGIPDLSRRAPQAFRGFHGVPDRFLSCSAMDGDSESVSNSDGCLKFERPDYRQAHGCPGILQESSSSMGVSDPSQLHGCLRLRVGTRRSPAAGGICGRSRNFGVIG